MTTPDAESVRVLIADDNKLVRRALRLRLEAANGVSVVGEAANGRDAVAVTRAERVDVVLMDIQMPGMSGIEATREIVGAASDHDVAVIIMTSHAGDQFILPALEAGAVGYLLKSHDTHHLLDAIHAAARGDAMVSSRATAPILRELARRRPAGGQPEVVATLSRAERRVVATLSRGVTGTDDIAAALHISVNTVRSQLQSALKKTGLEDRTQLALWGARNALDGDPA